MNAPPNALRRMTVTLGTVASANACTSLAPWRITPSLLLAGAGQKARRVDEHEQRQPEGVAGAHEARRLLRGVGVEHATEVPGLVGDDPDRATLQPRQGADDVARAPRRDLDQAPAVDQRARHVAHVIDLARLRGHGARGARLGRGDRRQHLRQLAAVLGQEVQQLARQQRRVEVSARREMAHAVSLVHARAAERGGPRRSPMTSETTAGPVRNIAAPSVMITKSLSAGPYADPPADGPADDRDLRDHARQAHVLGEDPPVARQRGEALLHARAGRLDEAEHRHARPAGEAQDLDDRLGVSLPERAAGERCVLRVAVDRAPVHACLRGEHPVAGPRALAHPPRAHLRAQQLQRPGVGRAPPGARAGQALVQALLEQGEPPCALQAEHRVVAAEAERVRQRERRLAVGRARADGPSLERSRGRGPPRALRSRSSAARRARPARAAWRRPPPRPRRRAGARSPTWWRRPGCAGALAQRPLDREVSARSFSGVDVPCALT